MYIELNRLEGWTGSLRGQKQCLHSFWANQTLLKPFEMLKWVQRIPVSHWSLWCCNLLCFAIVSHICFHSFPIKLMVLSAFHCCFQTAHSKEGSQPGLCWQPVTLSSPWGTWGWSLVNAISVCEMRSVQDIESCLHGRDFREQKGEMQKSWCFLLTC